MIYKKLTIFLVVAGIVYSKALPLWFGTVNHPKEYFYDIIVDRQHDAADDHKLSTTIDEHQIRDKEDGIDDKESGICHMIKNRVYAI